MVLSRSRFWIGTNFGLIKATWDRGKWSYQHYDIYQQTNVYHLIRKIFIDQAGNMWLGTYGGLFLWPSAYREKDDKDYLAYISQPFLTSEEQDHLVEQLRNAKYFDVFQYDAQEAGWNCTMCNM